MKEGTKGCLFLISVCLCWLSIVAYHLYCCYLAYVVGPFWKVVVTFFAPVLAESYWFVFVWQNAGGMTWFNLWGIGSLLLAVIVYGVSAIWERQAD